MLKTGYYASLDGQMDAEDVIERFGYDGNWYRGNIIKYAIRAGRKADNSAISDLEKIKAYAEMEIRHILRQEKAKGSN